VNEALDRLRARLSSFEAAMALSVHLRDQPMIDRVHALAVVDPIAAAVDVAAMAAPDHRTAEAQALAALFGEGVPPDGEHALLAAARVRFATDDLAGALDDMRRLCTDRLAEGWMAVAIDARGLQLRAEGELAAVLDPCDLVLHLPGHTLDLSRAHRRFALLWALATAPAVLPTESLFEHVWGRPWLDADDTTALQTTVSRTRTMLPRGVGLVGLPGGAYVLEPSWALFVPRDAPRSHAPLAPLGRDGEIAAVRRALRDHGLVVVHGIAGSGTSHLARSLADSWPSGALVHDLRQGPLTQQLGLVGKRLLVIDHADALQAAPVTDAPTIIARTAPLPGAPAVEVAELAPREAASLAKSLGVDDPEGARMPLSIRVEADAVFAIRPSAKRLLARLLAIPGGVPTGLARRLGGADLLATLDDLEALQRERLVVRRGTRLIAEDALRAQVEPEPAPAVAASWRAARLEEPPAAVVRRLDDALAHPNLDLANVALRHVIEACRDHPHLRARALLGLAEVASRSGRPDTGVEQELSGLTLHGSLAARYQLHLGVRLLWRGELAPAASRLRAAARLAGHLGDPSLERRAQITLAEVALRRGLVAACERILAGVQEDDETHRVVAAGAAIDREQPARAEALLAGCTSPGAALRRGQLATLRREQPDEHYAGAAAGYASTDRRWCAAALALAVRADHDTDIQLARARQALTPEDGGSATLLALVEATLSGDFAAARLALRHPEHRDVSTFPWDLVRFAARRAQR
jgi:hypothetical protein